MKQKQQRLQQTPRAFLRAGFSIMFLRVFLLFLAALSADTVRAQVLATDVSVIQFPGERQIRVSYTAPSQAIATFRFSTNSVPLDHREIPVRTLKGDINCLVAAGDHSFTWNMGHDFPGHVFSDLSAEVELYPTDDPPQYAASGLVGLEVPLRFWASEAELPFPIDADHWRLDWLLMRKIPASDGPVTLGSPNTEPGRFGSSEDERQVRITEPFYMGVFEVTQRQYINMRRPTTHDFWKGLFRNPTNCEVRAVSDVHFENDLRGKRDAGYDWPADGHAVAANSWFGFLRAASGDALAFDLPTEAQWEYACRAGTTSAYNNGATSNGQNIDPALDTIARYAYNGGMATNASGGYIDAPVYSDLSVGIARVGSYLPNAWGLYDMHGNVSEFCLDWYTDTVSQTSEYAGDDPAGPASGTWRTYRGGGSLNTVWHNARYARSAARRAFYNNLWNHGHIGFRVVAPARVASGTLVAPAATPPGVVGAATPPPQVSNTRISVLGTRARIRYKAEEAGIATFRIFTNGVALSGAEVSSISGEINQFVEPGQRAFEWDFGADCSALSKDWLAAEVSLWATNTPPPYFAFSPGENQARFYGSRDEIPGGEQDPRYKTDWLLLRQVPRTDGESATFGRAWYQGVNSIATNATDYIRSSTITQPFYVGVYEVTQKQWAEVTESWPSKFSNPLYRDMRPASSISYNDVRGSVGNGINWPTTGHAVDSASFLGKLRARSGGAFEFDIPTETQWEHACRAGSRFVWNNGFPENPGPNSTDLELDKLGRYARNGGMAQQPSGVEPDADCDPTLGTATVGSYLPNAWGLYDMHGNVFEYVLDWYTPNALDPSLSGDDPVGPAAQLDKRYRAFRGGGWFNNTYGGADRAYSSRRDIFALGMDNRYTSAGVRLTHAAAFSFATESPAPAPLPAGMFDSRAFTSSMSAPRQPMLLILR